VIFGVKRGSSSQRCYYLRTATRYIEVGASHSRCGLGP